MKCQKCFKQATYHITDIENRKFQEHHLCEECARQLLTPPEPVEEPFGMGKMAKELSAPADILDAIQAKPACPMCGATFTEFRTSGRLGCSHDYEVFRDELMPLLENIHESTNHEGKSPRRAPNATRQMVQLIQLRNDLKKAVAAENYEQAAKIRDRIKSMEQTSPSPLH